MIESLVSAEEISGARRSPNNREAEFIITRYMSERMDEWRNSELPTSMQ